MAHRRVAARPAGPDDETTTWPDGPLGGLEPPLDLDNPAHQQALLDAARGVRRGRALEEHLERLAEDQHQEREERLGYRGMGWIERTPF